MTIAGLWEAWGGSQADTGLERSRFQVPMELAKSLG